MLRIGVDLCALDPLYAGGVKTYSVGLLRALVAAIGSQATARKLALTVFCFSGNRSYVESIAGAGVKVVSLAGGDLLWRLANQSMDWLSWSVGNYRLPAAYERLLRRRNERAVERSVDLLYTPTTLLNWNSLHIPTLVSIHDIQHEYRPENFTRRARISRWTRYRLTCDAATRIQASSEYVRGSILEKYDFVAPEKIVVIPEGVDLLRFSPTALAEKPASLPADDRPFAFYPAQLWPHKNHRVLVDALCRLKERRQGKELRCVLTGKDYGTLADVMARAGREGLKELFYLGVVPEPELIWLYRNCRCALALGEYESSCLPIKEAMAVGCPVVAADIPPNVELAASTRLNLFGTNSVAGLADALEKCVGGEHTGDVAFNRAAVQEFSWAKVASAYLEVLQGMADRFAAKR